MAQRRSRQAPVRRSRNQRVGFSSASFFGGIAVGVAATVTVWLGGPVLVSSSTSASARASPDAPATPRTYEFWDRLPADEVSADAARYGPRPQAGSSTLDVTPAAEPIDYLIQAGSFKSPEDADALRGRLILDGYAVETSEAALPGGAIWYRVLVGPFAKYAEARRVMSELRHRDIDTMVVTRAVKGPDVATRPRTG